MTSKQRISLPRRDWPARDRALWDTACAPGDVFESGIASHLSPRSQTTIEWGYARWLGFLARTEPLALDLSPEDRITRTRVKTYLDDNSGRCSPTTVWNDVKALYDMVRFMVPATDWIWLKSVKARLERRIQRRRSPVIDTARLVDLGFVLMTDGIERLPSDRLAGALAYRDGLLIAFLAYRPLRRRTLAALMIGQQLQQIGTTWMLVLEASDLKNQRDADFSWPEPLVPALERYLADIRMLFPDASNHAGLWPSIKGRPMGEEAIYEAVRNRTKVALGIAINLHAFRHSSATTIAMHTPEALGIAAPLLTHADPRATECHYNLARHFEAGRAQTTIIDQLRARMRRASKNKRRP
jgi:integrase/recombinase XerD